MTRYLLAGVALSASVMGGAVSLVAHHSAASAYDTDKKITLKGTVTQVEWKNPHVFYYINVADESGATTNWAIEGSTPNQLYRSGWRKDDLKVGDAITVTGSSPARNGSTKAYGGVLTLADGRRVFGGSAATDR
jgi:DNA/RNA endonuclease YhcR with UshA esterase domain